MSIDANIHKIKEEIPAHVKLIAVSKTKPVELIQEAYDAGQRAFGENKVQEMVSKQPLLPQDVEWHLIGHLQSNKVKYIAPFVTLIHSVDSIKLLEVINKEAAKNNRVIDCLLQVFIAEEETKFGLDKKELFDLLASPALSALTNVRICGLMGMATNTGDEQQVRSEFNALKSIFVEVHQKLPSCTILSMGMSSDYKIAIEEGSTMIRIGSTIFGDR